MTVHAGPFHGVPLGRATEGLRTVDNFRIGATQKTTLTHLIVVGSGDKDDRALARNVEGAPRPHLPKEYVRDNPPEDKSSIINEVRALRMFYSSHGIHEGSRGVEEERKDGWGRGRSGEGGDRRRRPSVGACTSGPKSVPHNT